MDDSTLAGALASAETAFETTFEKVGAFEPPKPSLTVPPTIQPSQTEPSLTMESSFALPPPVSAYLHSTSSIRKREKRYTSFTDLGTVRGKGTRLMNKRRSRFVWQATPQLQARVQHELDAARIAVRLARTHIVPFRGIPYGPIAGARDCGAKSMSVSLFPGNVYIQEPVAAVSFALDEYETCRVDAANRLTFWVDASVRKGNDGSVGLAVVHKGSRDAKDWITKGYIFHKFLPSDQAECLAIAQALHDALDMVDGRPTLGSAVVVYSDSHSALMNILNFDIEDRKFGYAIIEIVMMKARELRHRGVRVFLHWVPSHQHVPGNELADWVAGLASKGE